VEHSLQESYN